MAELADPANQTINVFTIASGHMYERLVKIMMLSVTQRTHNPVKFWFLGNFASPAFKVGPDGVQLRGGRQGNGWAWVSCRVLRSSSPTL